MDRKQINEYIEKNGGITVPQLQLQFNLTYSQARKVVDDLISVKWLKYDSGIWYVSTRQPSPQRPYKIVVSNEPPERPKTRIVFKNGDDTGGKKTDGFDENARIARERRMASLKRSMGYVEPEIERYLTNLFASNKDITLKQALYQATSEQFRARRKGNLAAADTYGEVADYLSGCDELLFETVRKRLTNTDN